MTAPESAPRAVAQPQRLTVAFLLNESQSARCGLLERWQRAVKRREARAQKLAAAQTRLAEAVAMLVAKAESEQWSQRKLAGKIGIPETTFRRLRAQQVDPFAWLPKIEAAVARCQGG